MKGDRMKTNQIVETIDRELLGRIVKQRTKDGFMSLWDIESVGNLYRVNNGLPMINFKDYIYSKNVKEFLEELEREIGTKPYIKSTKGNSGWVHPFFAIKILTHFNPKFEVQVYKWLFDHLIDNRIRGGDSYNVMCGVLFKYADNKTIFYKNIKKVANSIKEILKVNDWNRATSEQLKERDCLQNYITDATRTLKNSTEGFKFGVKMYLSRLDKQITFK